MILCLTCVLSSFLVTFPTVAGLALQKLPRQAAARSIRTGHLSPAKWSFALCSDSVFAMAQDESIANGAARWGDLFAQASGVLWCLGAVVCVACPRALCHLRLLVVPGGILQR